MRDTCIIVATDREAEIIKGIVKTDRLIVSGIGAKGVKKAVNWAETRGLKHIVSFGTAGGLSPELKKGDVVIPKKIVGYKEKAVTVDLEWHKRVLSLLKKAPFSLSTEALLSVESVVAEPVRKKRLYIETGCVSLDMESYPIACACLEKKMHFLCIRAIADTYAMKIPDWLHLCINSSGQFLLDKFIKELLKHPFHTKEVICIGCGFFKARKSLRYVMNRINSALPDRALP